jgi:hypothetical protein
MFLSSADDATMLRSSTSEVRKVPLITLLSMDGKPITQPLK